MAIFFMSFFLIFLIILIFFFFFFNDTATTEIYTLSLHDALPICGGNRRNAGPLSVSCRCHGLAASEFIIIHNALADRKSTRLNSSHGYISYAVFCLKKKKQQE